MLCDRKHAWNIIDVENMYVGFIFDRLLEHLDAILTHLISITKKKGDGEPPDGTSRHGFAVFFGNFYCMVG
jgi:hypothetical protein